MINNGQDRDPGLTGMLQFAVKAEMMGFDSLWAASLHNHDAMSVITAIGMQTTRIDLGVGIVPIQQRHPYVMAQQAMTTAAATQGRFTLGIGVSSRYLIETMCGLDFSKPASHMREYLEALQPLMQKQHLNHQGERYHIDAAVECTDEQNIPIVTAALGENMLDIAGAMSDGVITWMVGLNTLFSHSIPRVQQAAKRAEREPPRIISLLPVALCQQRQSNYDFIKNQFGFYGNLPHYRAMLQMEGADNAADIALIGDEHYLSEQLDRLEDMGVTEFLAVPMNANESERSDTLSWLALRNTQEQI